MATGSIKKGKLMARYTKDLTLNLPEETVQYVVNDYLQKNEFATAEWQGETCLRAGGTMMGYRYLKWSYGGGVLHLEAWLESNTGKELGLDGVVGAAWKMPYKSSVDQLLSTLESQPQSGTAPTPVNVADSAAPANPTTAHPGAAPQTVDNSSKAIATFVLGLAAILLIWFWGFGGLLCGVIGISLSRFSKGSSQAVFAKIGLVLSIIAVVIFILSVILQVALLFGFVALLG